MKIIKDCLARLKPEAKQIIKYEVLQGGISGSYTYRVNLDSEEVVLKVTMPNAELYVVQRAQREAAFYRDLADHIPLNVPRLLSIYTNDVHGIYILLAAYHTDLALLFPVALGGRGSCRAIAQRFGGSLTLPRMGNFKPELVSTISSTDQVG